MNSSVVAILKICLNAVSGIISLIVNILSNKLDKADDDEE